MCAPSFANVVTGAVKTHNAATAAILRGVSRIENLFFLPVNLMIVSSLTSPPADVVRRPQARGAHSSVARAAGYGMQCLPDLLGKYLASALRFTFLQNISPLRIPSRPENGYTPW
jgi:hypothetical protein